MNLPLPQALHTENPTGDHNAGLWYDKFFHRWKPDFTGPIEASLKEDIKEGKAQWVDANATSVGEPASLKEAATRLTERMAVLGGFCKYFKTDGRFVTGLGREHPVQNGFAWHHTLGVPYLPGSSVKGVLRAWAREQGASKEDIERIFGPASRGSASVGSVVVGDALPTAPVQLAAEVMTPHYGPYYQDESAETPPADWHNTTPIPFLAVADNQPFLFALAPRRATDANDANDRADCERLLQWLPEALAWLGAGAKTSVGYGRFKADKAADHNAAEKAREELRERKQQADLAQRMQGLSSLAQELERTIIEHNLETDKNAFSSPPLIENWLDKLEAAPELDANQRFAELVRQHFPDLLENPSRTKGKKQNPVFNERQRGIAQRMRSMLG